MATRFTFLYVRTFYFYLSVCTLMINSTIFVESTEMLTEGFIDIIGRIPCNWIISSYAGPLTRGRGLSLVFKCSILEWQTRYKEILIQTTET